MLVRRVNASLERVGKVAGAQRFASVTQLALFPDNPALFDAVNVRCIPDSSNAHIGARMGPAETRRIEGIFARTDCLVRRSAVNRFDGCAGEATFVSGREHDDRAR